MNLVRAELARLLARRFVRLMTVLLVGACAIAVISTIASSHTPTSAEISQATRDAQVAFADAQRYHQECLAQDGRYGPCEAPDPADYRAEDFLYGIFVFAEEIPGLLYFLAAFLALFGFLVGASFVGAELSSGGMTNLLLWRPQRLIVLGTKLGTVLAAVVAVAVLGVIAYLAAFWVVADVSGFVGQVDGDFWPDLILLSVRGIALVVTTTAVGFAIATLGRHTAAALGVVAAYAVLWEIGLRIVLSTVEAGRPDAWMLSSYVAAFMDGEVSFYDQYADCVSYTASCSNEYVLTWVDGSLVGGVLAVAAIGASFLVFVRRDLA